MDTKDWILPTSPYRNNLTVYVSSVDQPVIIFISNIVMLEEWARNTYWHDVCLYNLTDVAISHNLALEYVWLRYKYIGIWNDTVTKLLLNPGIILCYTVPEMTRPLCWPTTRNTIPSTTTNTILKSNDEKNFALMQFSPLL